MTPPEREEGPLHPTPGSVAAGSLLEDGARVLREGLADLGGGARDRDSGGLEGGDLVDGAALAAGDDRAGVAHALAGRRVLSGDERGDGLLHALRDEARRGLLGAAADLADHHHGLRLGIGLEQRERVDEIRADHRVAADAEAGGLPDAEPRELIDRLVRERARARYHAHRT